MNIYSSQYNEEKKVNWEYNKSKLMMMAMVMKNNENCGETEGVVRIVRLCVHGCLGVNNSKCINYT